MNDAGERDAVVGEHVPGRNLRCYELGVWVIEPRLQLRSASSSGSCAGTPA